METRPRIPRLALALALSLALFGAACGGAFSDNGASVPSPTPTTTPTTSDSRITIEESDIYRRDGSTLYALNAETGLNILDLRAPTQPRLLGRIAVDMSGAELYLHAGHALVLGRSSEGCTATSYSSYNGWVYDTALTTVNVLRPEAPHIATTLCIPGELVASRVYGDYLIVFTTNPYAATNAIATNAYAFDMRDPSAPALSSTTAMRGVGKEIFAAPGAIYVAGRVDDCSYGCDGYADTRVQVLSVDGRTGKLARRGAAVVRGEPQGRFHMDARDGQFRIVTFDSRTAESVLSVLDVTNPDGPLQLGQLGGLGRGERLYATRFDGARAYLVTFRVTDPLWIVSLTDPRSPRLRGELTVPGWSDFIYPRGDRLLAVGRAGRSGGVQVSLFDVADATAPRALTQLQLGDWGATSTANLDHRAVTVIEPAAGGADVLPVVVVPYSFGTAGYGCSPEHLLQLLDIDRAALVPRGVAQQTGTVLRTFDAGGVLVGLSDYEVRSFDLSDRDYPTAVGIAVIGTRNALLCSGAYAETTPSPATPVTPRPMGNDAIGHRFLGCSATGGESMAVPFAALLIALVAARLRRRGRI